MRKLLLGAFGKESLFFSPEEFTKKKKKDFPLIRGVKKSVVVLITAGSHLDTRQITVLRTN